MQVSKKARRLCAGLREEIRPWWRTPGKKPLARQAREALGLWRTFGTPPTQYLRAHLYRRDAGDPAAFLPFAVVENFQNAVNPADRCAVVNDKVLFHRVMSAHGVPSIPTLAFITPTEIRGEDEEPVSAERLAERLGQRALFVKNSQGHFGKGAFTSRGLDADHVARLQAAGGRYLVQPLVEQCRELAAFHPASLNTIRIATYADPAGEVSVLAATLKMGMKGACVDNRLHGGLFVGIDLATGRLRDWGVSAATGSDRLAAHPDTGVAFAGVAVPFWDEVLATTRRAARAVPELGTIGWDIAVSPTGPVVVEGNRNWGANLFQSVATPLGGTALGAPALAAWRNRGGRR
jgi:hypothetical protein